LDINLAETVEVDGMLLHSETRLPVTGTVMARHPNGRLQQRRSVVNGQADGAWFEWFEDGTVRLYAEWRAGKGHGAWVYFHPNGEVRSREQALDDIWDGVSEGWHANGTKAFEGRFQAGIRLTAARRWDRDGVAVGPWVELAGGSSPRAVLDEGWPEDVAQWDFSFSPDLETLFVATGNANGSARRILIRRWRNGTWMAPEPAPFAQLDAAEGTPVMSPDGRHVYFSSDRHSRAEPDNPRRDLYRASASSGWMRVDRVTNTPAYGEVSLSLSIDGTGVMWTDRRTDGTATMGLYEVRLDEMGTREPAVSVLADLNDLHLNDQGNENSALIASDGSFVIFANYDVGGAGTDEDLFVTRRESGGWSAPRPLQGGVNTAGTESNPQLIENGRTLAWRYDGPEGAGFRVISLAQALGKGDGE